MNRSAIYVCLVVVVMSLSADAFLGRGKKNKHHYGPVGYAPQGYGYEPFGQAVYDGISHEMHVPHSSYPVVQQVIPTGHHHLGHNVGHNAGNSAASASASAGSASASASAADGGHHGTHGIMEPYGVTGHHGYSHHGRVGRLGRHGRHGRHHAEPYAAYGAPVYGEYY